MTKLATVSPVHGLVRTLEPPKGDINGFLRPSMGIIPRGAIMGRRAGSRLLEPVLDSSARSDLEILGCLDMDTIPAFTESGTNGEAVDSDGLPIQVRLRDGALGAFDTGTGVNEIDKYDIGKQCFAKNDNTLYLTDDGGTLSFAGVITGVNADSKIEFATDWRIRAMWKALTATGASDLGVVALMPADFILLTGAPLAIFADGASAVPGSAIVDSKANVIRWNNNATLNGVMASFLVPLDMDITANATVTIRASKTGATLADAVTFAVGAYNQEVGALHDADTNYGGTTSAMTGDVLAKRIQAVTLALALADLAAYPASVTLTVKPTDGTLGTDDLVVHSVVVTYKKKTS